jgi:hypothetical protein
MLQRKLAGYFETWAITVEESMRLKRVGQKVIKRMLQRKLAGCFEMWVIAAEETKRLKLVGQCVVKRMLQQNLARSFLNWTDTVAETKRLRHIVRRVGARWHKVGLVVMLCKWKDFIAERKDNQEIVRCWLLAVNNREILSAVRTWKSFVDHEIEQEQNNVAINHEQERLLYEFAKRQRFRIMFRSVSRWQRIVLRHKKSQHGSTRFQHSAPVAPQMKKEVDIDTLVELIGELIVKKMLAEQADQHTVLAERVRQDECAKQAEGAKQAETLMVAEQKSPLKRRPQTKPKPWIASLSTSPSHSKVVASHEEFMQAYRYQQKMYKGDHGSERREQHQTGATQKMSPEEKRNTMLKQEVKKFLLVITNSFAQIDGHKRKRSTHNRRKHQTKNFAGK